MMKTLVNDPSSGDDVYVRINGGRGVSLYRFLSWHDPENVVVQTAIYDPRQEHLAIVPRTDLVENPYVAAEEARFEEEKAAYYQGVDW